MAFLDAVLAAVEADLCVDTAHRYSTGFSVAEQVLPVALGRQMRDQFVRNNGYAGQAAPEPARGSGSHVKTVYAGCRPGYPVTFVAFDGDHTPQPKDRGAAATFSGSET